MSAVIKPKPGDLVDGFIYLGDSPELLAAVRGQSELSDACTPQDVRSEDRRLILAALDQALASEEGAKAWGRCFGCSRRTVDRYRRKLASQARQTSSALSQSE